MICIRDISFYDWLDEDTRLGAFNLTHVASGHQIGGESDRVDVRYQTAPVDVKPFPSPPETPLEMASSDWSDREKDKFGEDSASWQSVKDLPLLFERQQGVESDGASSSGRSSLAEVPLDDDSVRRAIFEMMLNMGNTNYVHTLLIREF